MKIKILRSAIEDMAAGRSFYDRQGEGIGAYFASCMFAEIDSLVLQAGHHRVVIGYHRIITRRFPYAIYYKKTDDFVVVHRILDCRRTPKWIAGALQG